MLFCDTGKVELAVYTAARRTQAQQAHRERLHFTDVKPISVVVTIVIVSVFTSFSVLTLFAFHIQRSVVFLRSGL
jgi:uncharacterized membrane protein YidH (DUF202 family)